MAFTCNGEENPALPVLLSHWCRQVTLVHGAIAARDAGQEDAERVDLELQLTAYALVQPGGVGAQICGQKAAETRRGSLSDLRQHRKSVRPLMNVKLTHLMMTVVQQNRINDNKASGSGNC